MNLPLSGTELAEIASKGSPALIHAVGRAFGIGQEERDALTKGAFPVWFWVTAGAVAGAFAGVYAQRMWPEQVAKVWKGSRR